MPAGPDSRPDTATTPALLSGRYRLDAVIGQGGVGTVWRARDLQLDRDVAVKQLQPGVARDPMAADRFRREATTAASLSHQSLVTIYDVGEDDDVVYLVMELVDGPSLKDVLAEGGPLSGDETAAVGHRVAGALVAVHERGLVHRDVKPGNVLLPVDGPPKLVDFGTVHVLGDNAATLTMPGTMLGTIGYVAPEQFEGHDVDPRADVFAVGLLLHECLTGEPTFGTGTIAEMTRRRLADDVTPPSELRADVPAELDAIVTRATRRDPADRFADATELMAALTPLVPGDAEGRLQALARQFAVPLGDPSPPTRSTPTDHAPSPSAPRHHEETVVIGREDGAPASSGANPPVVPPGPPVAPGPAPSRGADDHARTSVLPAVGTEAAPASAGAASPDIDTAPEQGPDDDGRGGLRRLLMPLAALAVLALAITVIGLGTLGGDGGPEGGNGGGGSNGGNQQDGAGTETVAVADASDFDPFGGGGEHPEDVDLAHDGDPATRWDTEGYNSRAFGGLKDGVGIWFQASDAASRVEVALAPAGSDVQLYALEGPPGNDPAGWGEPIAQQAGADSIAADLPEGTQVVLVWFTQTAPSDGNRAGVAEVTFRP